MVFQCLTGNSREDRGALFTRMHSERTRCHEPQVASGKFFLAVRKKTTKTNPQFFAMRTIKQCNSLPREAVDFLSLEVFKP